MLAYARTAQNLNGSRGLPVFTEAVIYHDQLRASPDAGFARERALDAYRRAVGVDPWNPYVLLRMSRFVLENPSLADDLSDEEHPAVLLVRAVTLDPVFIPGYEALIGYFNRIGQPEVAVEIVKEKLLPWLEWLAHGDKVSAVRYLEYLRASTDATEHTEFAEYLAEVAQRIAPIKTTVPTPGWFD